MPYCTNCGKQIPTGVAFCQNCGEKAASQQTSGTTDPNDSPVYQIKKITSQQTWTPREEEHDYALFIGDNVQKYLMKFEKFNQDGVDSYAVTWHWPAFFVTGPWLLYRKLYGWFAINLVLSLIPIVNIIANITFAMSANYIYYRHMQKKLYDLKITRKELTDAQWDSTVTSAGGTSSASLLILIPIIILLVMLEFAKKGGL